jgi:type IV secretory pathway VirJ component
MDETASLCPRLHAANVTRVALPGGHMLRWDTERVAQLLADATRAAIAAPRSVAPLRLAASIAYPEKGP